MYFMVYYNKLLFNAVYIYYMQHKKWYRIPVTDIYTFFNVDPELGHDNKAVEQLRATYGKNELPTKDGFSKTKLFLSQFHNILIYILVIAAGISFILDHAVDGYIISAAILVNVFVGYIQEYKAQTALENLKHVITRHCVVLREKRLRKIPVQELVPGDIIEIGAGARIPADCRLIYAKDVEVSEANLTGESVAIAKEVMRHHDDVALADRKNMLYMGTIVDRGTARAIVVETGINTEIGKIADLIQKTKEDETPLQHQLSVFSKELGIAIIFLSIIIFILGALLGRDWVEMFIIAIATAVSAIPEGLVIAVTVILAIGMERILKKKALVRRLIAAETLGSTDIVCSDKTGTLTEGNMRTVALITPHSVFNIDQLKKSTLGEDIRTLLMIGLLCNEVNVENPSAPRAKWKIIGAPTERALYLAGIEAGFTQEQLLEDRPLLDEDPFNSTRKYRISLHKIGSHYNELYYSGAPERLLEKSTHIASKDGDEIIDLTDAKRQELLDRHNEYSRQGLRILGIAFKRVDSSIMHIDGQADEQLIFAGFYIIKDPVRKNVKQTIEVARLAGIRTVMITGDHKNTARSIAKELGLPVQNDVAVIDGIELSQMSEVEFSKRVDDIYVYARVSPEDKLRIVDAYQAKGHVVAMTGDGVNDAPALKTADIGIAVGSGADVTKGVADMVLLDNNFKTIIDAIRQGRIIVDNIKKVIVYLLADSFTAMVLIVGSLLFGLPLPITAAQVLWINLVTDSFPYIALTLEKGERDIMKLKPRRKNEPIVDREMKVLIFIIGLVTDVMLIGLFAWYYHVYGDLQHVRTIVFAALGLATLIYVFSCRSLRQPIWKTGIMGNKYLVFAVCIGLFFQLGALYIPFLRDILGLDILGIGDWFVIIGLSLLKITGIEVTKWFFITRKVDIA